MSGEASSQSQQELHDGTYRAIGRFVVKFSHLMEAFEEATISLCLPIQLGKRHFMKALFGDRTAAPIANAFFAVFHEKWNGTLSKEDAELIKHLRNQALDLIEIRNRMMHDSWHYVTVGGDPGPQKLSRSRFKATATKPAAYQFVDPSPAEIEELAEDAERLRMAIWGCLRTDLDPSTSGPKLDESLEIIDNNLRRKSLSGIERTGE